MDTNEKCAFIMRKLIELAIERGQVVLERDVFKGSLTILLNEIDGKNITHTHVGQVGGTTEQIISSMYAQLHGRKGMAWITPLDEEDNG